MKKRKVRLIEVFKRYLSEARFPWEKFPAPGGRGDGKPDLRAKKGRDVSSIGPTTPTSGNSNFNEDEVHVIVGVLYDALSGEVDNVDKKAATDLYNKVSDEHDDASFGILTDGEKELVKDIAKKSLSTNNWEPAFAKKIKDLINIL